MNRMSVSAVLMAVGVMVGLVPAVSAERQGDQGIGFMVGNPSGFSYKIFLDDKVAIDAAFGVAQHELDAHATLLFHDFNFLRRSPSFSGITRNGDAPVYFGLGARGLFEDDDTEFGIRLPVGMSFFSNQAPWEAFGEIAPVVRLTPSSGVDLDFAIGVRYYFPTVRPRAN